MRRAGRTEQRCPEHVLLFEFLLFLYISVSLLLCKRRSYVGSCSLRRTYTRCIHILDGTSRRGAACPAAVNEKHTPKSVTQIMNINSPTLQSGYCVWTEPEASQVSQLKVRHLFSHKAELPSSDAPQGCLRFKQTVGLLTDPLLTCKYEGNGLRALRGQRVAIEETGKRTTAYTETTERERERATFLCARMNPLLPQSRAVHLNLWDRSPHKELSHGATKDYIHTHKTWCSFLS